jgi:hypothetical protein
MLQAFSWRSFTHKCFFCTSCAVVQATEQKPLFREEMQEIASQIDIKGIEGVGKGGKSSGILKSSKMIIPFFLSDQWAQIPTRGVN